MKADLDEHRPINAGRALVPRAVVERLQRLILDGGIKPGEKLPSQRELSEAYGISRPSLREALSVIETMGLIRVEPGRGVFVNAAEERAPLWRFASRCSPRDVYEARYCLESFAAGLAARRMGPDRLQRMRESVEQMAAAAGAVDLFTMAGADSAFHDLIFEACGNPMLAAMYRSVRDMMVESQKLPMTSHGKLQETVAEHRTLLAAFESGDALAAESAMQAHIRAAAGRVGVALTA